MSRGNRWPVLTEGFNERQKQRILIKKEKEYEQVLD